MLKMEKPCTAMPRTSRLLLSWRATSMFEKSKDVLTQTIRPLLQPLRWCCVDCVIHHERDVREEQHHKYMWREQAIIEWSWHVNSIVACCHSAKLCAYAARDFRSQYHHLCLWKEACFCELPDSGGWKAGILVSDATLGCRVHQVSRLVQKGSF